MELIDEINEIINEYNKYVSLNHINYNIFSILKLSSREVRLHSAFLADLLNPKGKHEFGSLFLSLFLNVVMEKANSEIKTLIYSQKNEQFKISVEKYIGKINKDKTEGGRIDILLESKKIIIVIENKIYAVDQKNQLLRYENYLRNRNKRGVIIYLTLDERNMEAYNNKYINLTYKEDISNFLEKSLENTLHPSVRSIIEQYFNTVKKLTSTSITSEYRMRIMNEILKSAKNIIVAREIYENYNKAEDELAKAYFLKLGRYLKNREIAFEANDSDLLKIPINQNVYLNFKYNNKVIYIGVQIDGTAHLVEEMKNELIGLDYFEDAQFAICKKETNFNLRTQFSRTINLLYASNEDDIFDDIYEVYQVVKDKIEN